MSDTKISSLPAAASVNLSDLLVKVNDPGGTPATQRATVTQLQSSLTGKQDALGFTAENVANKDTDGTLAANSDTKYPSQKATKTYVDSQVATVTDTWKDTWEAIYFGGNGAVSVGDVWALTGTSSSSDGVITGVSKTQLPGNQYSTNSATNAQASWGGVTQYTFGSRLRSVMNVLLTDKTNIRAWIGFTNATGLQQLGSATPAFSYAAFRYDTSVPDDGWEAICGNGVSQTLVNTQVVPSITVTQIMRIEWAKDATSVLFYINNNLVATIAATLPAQGAVLRQMNGIQTLANAQKFIIVSSVKVRMSSLA